MCEGVCVCGRACRHGLPNPLHTAAMKHSPREVVVDEAEDVICARNPKLGIDLLTPPPPTSHLPPQPTPAFPHFPPPPPFISQYFFFFKFY